MKKFTAIILASCILLSAFVFSGCKNTPAEGQTTQGEASDTVNNTSSTETEGSPIEILPEGQRLIYYEDFERFDMSFGTARLFKELGWQIDNTYSKNSATIEIAEIENSNQLFIMNYGEKNVDSYFLLLSAEQFGKYHEKNYTYQYDVRYKISSNPQRYITVLSEYNSDFFTSFHLRMNGMANHEYYTYQGWRSYDRGSEYDACATDENSIVSKLLGKQFDKNETTLRDLSISIRYVVDWDNGNSVYLRLNDEGFENTGKWILVSKSTNADDATAYRHPEKTGAGIVLKAGGSINGYIDNITIWEGTGEEPQDKRAPLINSHSEGCSGHTYSGSGNCASPGRCVYCGAVSLDKEPHKFVASATAGEEICSVCQAPKSSVDAGWIMERLPIYIGGKSSQALYSSGHGIHTDTKFRLNEESMMQIISETNSEEFNAYCELLTKYGAERLYTYERDGNLYAQFSYADNYIYTYYTASVDEVRIILDTQSESFPDEFSYDYQKKDSDTTIVYQYGLPMRKSMAEWDSHLECGMMYVIKLADNSVMIIDGGGFQQFDTAQIDDFMSFLRNVTGTEDGDKIKIAAWYITHGHSDHMSGFALFAKKYGQNIDLDRILFNFPSVNYDEEVFYDARANYVKLNQYFDQYIDSDTKYMKIHTGQVFNFAGVKMNVLQTHEDVVDPLNCNSAIANDYNNSCAVVKFEFDGKSLLILGDINTPAMDILMTNNSEETLKCDILQLAHHVLNDLSKLYHQLKAPILFVPQSPWGSTNFDIRQKAFAAASQYAAEGMIFYASEYTYGLSVQDGTLVKVNEYPIVGGAYTGDWGW